MKKETEETNTKSEERVRVTIPIGVKLAIIIGIVILISFSGLIFFTSRLMARSMKMSAMQNNLSVNLRTASAVENHIDSICSSSFQVLDLINAAGNGKYASFGQLSKELFFKRNSDIISVLVFDKDATGNDFKTIVKLYNTNYLSQKNLKTSDISSISEKNKENILNVINGSISSKSVNCSFVFNESVMEIFIPWSDGEKNLCCGIIFGLNKFEDILDNNGENFSFIVNDEGYFLYDGNFLNLLNNEKLENTDLVKIITSSIDTNENFQISYSESEGKIQEKFLGAVKCIPEGNIIVVSSISLSDALEDVYKTQKNNYILSAIILFTTILIILIYSRYGISKPLYRLVAAADEIQKGNFNSKKIDRLNDKRMDEIGVLNSSTKAERNFLNVFARFTNQNVAKLIATNELDFNPHLKDTTIFFSDIRGFTSICDSFKEKYGENSATKIIEFLNDYLSRMVNCITLSNGTVDKFEGDAIMGFWGHLRDDNMDYEIPFEEHKKRIETEKGRELTDSEEKKLIARRNELEKKHKNNVMADAVDSITGSIAMRYSLMEYNKIASEKDLPHIQIGCGLNTGRTTVGIIGDNSNSTDDNDYAELAKDKIEYTAIGDAVNLASRTESSNKVCGTDILITEDTYNILKLDYIRCKENDFTIPSKNVKKEIVVEKIPAKFEVKGKGKQTFYAVVNMPAFNVQEFFSKNNKSFKTDPDCLKACGPEGPESLKELRKLLGISKPDFKKVNVNEEENKVIFTK